MQIDYAIFLRGVNVNGIKILSKDLIDCLSKLNVSNIRVIMQTGNVVLSSELPEDDLKRHIEDTLSKTFGYDANVLIYQLNKLKNIAERYPFMPREGYHSYLVFVQPGSMAADIAKPELVDSKLEQIMTSDGIIFWQVVKGHTSDSSFAKELYKPKYKEFLTTRNLQTVIKMLS